MFTQLSEDIRYRHVVDAVFDSPWYITEAKLNEIALFVRSKALGLEVERFEAAVKAPPTRSQGPVAVLNLFGSISQRANLMTQYSGGTSTEMFGRAFDAAMAEDSIKSILLNIDSPGGSVFGVDELSKKIYQARGQKPIVAIANSMAASAAYYIGSSANEMVITPSGMAGSIGVVYAHTDMSGAEASMGVKTTLITSGKYKAEGNSYEPLTDEARASLQRMSDDYYGMFVAAVARNRGVTENAVRGGYGEGRVLTAAAAVKEGLVDRVATFEQTLARLGGQGRATVITAEESRKRLEAIAEIALMEGPGSALAPISGPQE